MDNLCSIDIGLDFPLFFHFFVGDRIHELEISP